MISPTKQKSATILGCISLWTWACAATLFTFLKHIPFFEMITIQFIAAFLLAAIWLTATRSWHKIRQPIFLWIVGLVGTSINDILYASAFRFAPAVQVDLINYLWPLIVILLAASLRHIQLTIRHIIAATIGFIGVAILLTKGHILLNFQWQYWPGYALALSDACTWALFIVLSRKYSNCPPQIIGLYCGMTILPTALLHLHLEHYVSPTMFEWIVLVVMGLLNQGFAYYFWDVGIRRGNFHLLNILAYANPIISVFLLVLSGYAKPTIYLAIATILVAFAGLFSSVSLKNFRNILRKENTYLT